MSKKFLNDIEIAAGIKVSSGTPGSGKVLTSDGSGNGTWQAAASGGILYNGSTYQDVNTNFGTGVPLGPSFGYKRIAMLVPTGSGAAGTGIGVGTVAVTGTLSSNAATTTNFRTQSLALRWVGSASAGQTASWRSGNASEFWMGNAARRGGFTAFFKFSIPVQPSGYIFYCGINQARAAIGATTEASTVTSTLHIGKDSTDTNLQFMHNDASGACTKVSTGVTASTTTVYLLIIHSEPNGTTAYFTLVDLETGSVLATTSATTNLPNVFMSPQQHISNNATATAVEACCHGFYCETNN